MRFIAISTVALAAFASAVPYALDGHGHGHQVAHGKEHRAHAAHQFDYIAGRSVSYDGACGSWSGASCPAGFCCGPNGWCGIAAEHCGVGCQSGFGDCGSAASPVSAVSSQSSAANETQSTLTLTTFSTAASKTSIRVSSEASSTMTGPSGASSTTEPSTPSISISLANKGPGDRPGRGRPSYGEPHTTLITKTLPGQPSPTEASTSPPQEPATSPIGQPSSSAYSPPASSDPSDEPTAPRPSPPVSSASSAWPSNAPTASTSYGGATPTPTSGGGDSGKGGDSGSQGSGGSQSQGGSYIATYRGTGTSSDGWPSQNEWLSFENLWEINQDIMKSSCSNAFSQIDDSEQELADIKSSIEDVSASAGVDIAFVFAVMMQESNGCVRVQTTSYSHANPGLFQSHEGEGSCNDGSGVQNPCPREEIHQMIEDGVAGTAAGVGLKQLLAKAMGDGAQKYYQAARMYNSGSLDPSGNLGLGVATHCYCSDIANRLTGWSAGASQCDAATVGA